MADSYRPDDVGMRTLANSAPMLRGMLAAAARGKRYAERISPRVSGAYAASFEIVPDVHTKTGRQRVAARLSNGAAYAPAVERRHRVLSRTVDEIEGS